MELLKTAADYTDRINAYFKFIAGEYHMEKLPAKGSKDPTELIDTQVWDRLPEPALLTGLALFLGFSSREAFEAYESTGNCRRIIRIARLRVEAEYEKRLHQQSPTGAIFALKSLGWQEKTTKGTKTTPPANLKVITTVAGPPVAGNEKDVVM